MQYETKQSNSPNWVVRGSRKKKEKKMMGLELKNESKNEYYYKIYMFGC